MNKNLTIDILELLILITLLTYSINSNKVKTYIDKETCVNYYYNKGGIIERKDVNGDVYVNCKGN